MPTIFVEEILSHLSILDDCAANSILEDRSWTTLFGNFAGSLVRRKARDLALSEAKRNQLYLLRQEIPPSKNKDTILESDAAFTRRSMGEIKNTKIQLDSIRGINLTGTTEKAIDKLNRIIHKGYLYFKAYNLLDCQNTEVEGKDADPLKVFALGMARYKIGLIKREGALRDKLRDEDIVKKLSRMADNLVNALTDCLKDIPRTDHRYKEIVYQMSGFGLNQESKIRESGAISITIPLSKLLSIIPVLGSMIPDYHLKLTPGAGLMNSQLSNVEAQVNELLKEDANYQVWFAQASKESEGEQTDLVNTEAIDDSGASSELQTIDPQLTAGAQDIKQRVMHLYPPKERRISGVSLNNNNNNNNNGVRPIPDGDVKIVDNRVPIVIHESDGEDDDDDDDDDNVDTAKNNSDTKLKAMRKK